MPKLERIKTALVGLKMPRALEFDDTVGRLERGDSPRSRRSTRCWPKN